MPFINWDENFTTGISECDIQHKKLINMLNAIYEAIRLNVEKKALKDSLNALIEYFDKHFDFEEKLMEMYGYPELENHKEEHKKFRETLSKLLEDPKEGNINFLEILKFFKNWWQNHILTMDRKYGLFLETKIKK